MSEHETALRRWLAEYKRRGGVHSASLEGLLNGLMEEHRKAIVRARNEGLEKAAEFVRREMVEGGWCADAILAMKEPEE